MKQLHLIIAALTALFLLGCAKDNKQEPEDPEIPADDYKLVWSDEFSYDGLPDDSKWSYDVGGSGWGNSEAQYYTNARLQNAEVKSGYLHINAIKEDFEGKKYTSARLVTKTKGDWTYGRIEVRAKLPEGIGMWPAIWMRSEERRVG